MQERGVKPGKAGSFASKAGGLLWVWRSNDPAGKVEWGYHVAPTIPVQGKDGKVGDMVVDHSLLARPVTVDEWTKAQHDPPVTVQTKPGEPPIPQRGGSGYWPGPDPPRGPDKHAAETMLRYKRCEGKTF